MARFIGAPEHRGRRTALAAALLALVSLGTGETGGARPAPGARGAARPLVAADAAACGRASALCLGGGRFAVEAYWRTPDGSGGFGQPVPLASDSGYFWFFDPENVELAVKVLNGCGINNRFWFFAGGLTDVEVTLIVIDNSFGRTMVYTNPQGRAFQPITDTAAFETCSDADAALGTRNPEEPRQAYSGMERSFAAPSSEIGCVPSETALCIRGRFRVEAAWHTTSGASGPAHAVPLTSRAGYFWFFEPSNLELIAKALDACPIGMGQWFFAAGLTDVGVDTTITDTFTGERRQYSNPLGTPFLPVLDTAAFSFCPTPTPTPTPDRHASPTPTPTATPTPLFGFDVRLETESCLNPRIVPSQLSIYNTDTVRWTAGDCEHRIVSDDVGNPFDSGTLPPAPLSSEGISLRSPGRKSKSPTPASCTERPARSTYGGILGFRCRDRAVELPEAVDHGKRRPSEGSSEPSQGKRPELPGASEETRSSPWRDVHSRKDGS